MIDFPIEIRYFIFKYGLDLQKIDAVFMTHSHGDHFNPMDLVMNYGISTSKNEGSSLSVYANQNIIEILNKGIKLSIGTLVINAGVCFIAILIGDILAIGSLLIRLFVIYIVVKSRNFYFELDKN